MTPARSLIGALLAGVALAAPAAAAGLRRDFDQRLLSLELQYLPRMNPVEPSDPDYGPLRGPDPLLYGSGNLAGVVRASTQEGERRERIDRIRDLFPAIRACWRPPRRADGPSGMAVTVRLSFKRSGEVLGQPRVTYHKAAGDTQSQERFRRSITDALQRCTPLPFTDGFGGAIAGRPLTIRFIDDQAL